MFGLFKKESRNNTLVVFDDDTVYHGEHGRVIVTHKNKKYVGREISFAFIGALKVPTLTLEVVQQIYAEAKSQGYVVHEIVKYATID